MPIMLRWTLMAGTRLVIVLMMAFGALLIMNTVYSSHVLLVLQPSEAGWHSAFSGIVRSEHTQFDGEEPADNWQPGPQLRGPLPNGLWRSRSTADLGVFDKRAGRSYPCYSSAVALVDEAPLQEIERETLDAQLENDSRSELEYWGTVNCFQYDQINNWPPSLPSAAIGSPIPA